MAKAKKAAKEAEKKLKTAKKALKFESAEIKNTKTGIKLNKLAVKKGDVLNKGEYGQELKTLRGSLSKQKNVRGKISQAVSDRSRTATRTAGIAKRVAKKIK
jgi:hypothetical protein